MVVDDLVKLTGGIFIVNSPLGENGKDFVG